MSRAEERPEHTAPKPRWARLRRLRAWLSRRWQQAQPGPRVRRGAGWGVALLALVVVGATGSATVVLGWGPVLDPLAGGLVGILLAALLGLAVLLVTRLLMLLPRFVSWLGLAALGAVVLVLVLLGFPVPAALIAGLPLGLLEAVLAGALAFLVGGAAGSPGWIKKTLVAVVAVAALAANLRVIRWLAIPGNSEHLAAAPTEVVDVEPLAAPDPSQPGRYPVLTLTYGSGEDRRRPEFGSAADLITETVDATPFVKGSKGWGIKVRQWYWGFDFEHFPVNGRVWYPDGEGPFPLVLIVHGNHRMSEFSDPGYAYLGELAASRGFIFVSVDENFFNGFWSGGLRKENDGRGWMLLEHLEAWRRWNSEEGNPFTGKVDLERIALIGHSRGGEAAAIAAAFNRLPRYPDDASVELDHGFGIRGVVAIAPSDGQYKPAGKPNPLRDLDYLVLQGGHDSDVSSFLGARQYERVAFTGGGYHFKASVYAYRANHGQFNTVWGRTDFSWPFSMLINTDPLLAGEEQRQLGKVYISAFLEATLHDDPTYLPLFRDHRAAAGWLPNDLLITRFEDSSFRPLAGFDEDVDVTTATLPGARIEGRDLAVWREGELEFRKQGGKEHNAVFLGWRWQPAGEEGVTTDGEAEVPALAGAVPEAEAAAEGASSSGVPASYRVALPPGLAGQWGLGEGTLLVFSLADADEELPQDEGEEGEDGNESEDGGDGGGTGAEGVGEGEPGGAGGDGGGEAGEDRGDDDEAREPLDLSIELVTADGAAARLPLSRFRTLMPPLPSRFLKLPEGAEADVRGEAWERTLQTFELPLAAFAAATPAFDPAQLAEIRFVFDRSPEGVVILDDLGFAEPRPGAEPPR